jgi:hypothetical protein
VIRPDCVLASNTSTLDIDIFAQSSGRPGQVIGHHFFSPANIMKLLEIVRGRETTPSVIATSVKLGKRLAKVPVVVGNCFGFVANRMLAYYMREAYLLLEEGASVPQIDRVLTEFGLPVDVVKQVCVRQLRFLDQQAGYFHDRVRASRIVEGHGDLRPEHICLDAAPHILDSLEFSRDLRTLDVVDELGFLALECERLGAPQARRYIFSAYRRTTGDAPPDPLIHFYQSFRAAVRAMLAIRHLLDPGTRDVHRWPVQARRYLELALTHIEQCDSGATASKSIAARPRVRRRLVGAPTQRSSNKETP